MAGPHRLPLDLAPVFRLDRRGPELQRPRALEHDEDVLFHRMTMGRRAGVAGVQVPQFRPLRSAPALRATIVQQPAGPS